GEGMDWLVAHGCDFDKKPGKNVSDRSMLSTSGGMGLVDALVAAAEAAGAQIMMETRAVEVLTDGGAVSGLVARRGDVEVRIAAGAVVLATGGFDGQDWSKEAYAKGAVGWHTFSSPANMCFVKPQFH
ncbi:MAG: FAD-binding protein, partial [Olsenella sp.]|nr:FAD-binding protein [Olsenella sp.]